MLKLLNRSAGVPENSDGRYFRYRHPETGHWSDAMDWYSWQDAIRDHRKANDLTPLPAVESEDQLCRSLPPGWCEQDAGEANTSVNTRFGWDEFAAGMKAFGRLMLGGFNFVAQPEANRRAAICSACFFNVGLAGCGTCRKMASLITGDVAQKKTPYDYKLQACGVCQCALTALVHFPMDALDTTPEKQAQYPDFCWQNRDSENFVDLLANGVNSPRPATSAAALSPA